MARRYSTIFARGLTGILNDPFKIETRSGKALTTDKVLFDDNREHLDSLKPHQTTLLEATTYANFARAHDVYLNKELETGMTAYNLAIADWFVGPRVLEIDVDCWTGKIGQLIRVKARDNVTVARVWVVVRDAEGRLLETGGAVQCESGSAWWAYVTTSLVPMTPFPTVKAIAEDVPGNSDSFTIR